MFICFFGMIAMTLKWGEHDENAYMGMAPVLCFIAVFLLVSGNVFFINETPEGRYRVF